MGTQIVLIWIAIAALTVASIFNTLSIRNLNQCIRYSTEVLEKFAKARWGGGTYD